MQDKVKEIAKAIEAVMKEMGMVVNPEIAEQLCTDCIKLKVQANLLGLSKENDWRTSFALPENKDSRPHEWDFIRAISNISPDYKPIDLAFMYEGRNKIRIAKLIKKHWEYLSRLPLPLFNDPHNYANQAMIDFGSDKSLHYFLTWYGDRIKEDRVGWISCNPYDYVTMAGNNKCNYASFTSCLRIGGEYFGGVAAYMLSDCTYLIYIATSKTPGKKIGRTVLFTNNDAVYTGRMYGSIFERDCLFMRDYIQDRIGGKFMVGKGGLTEGVMSNTGAGYIDWGSGTYTYHKDTNPSPFIIPIAACWKCGKKAGPTGYCDKCSGRSRQYICDNCGHGMNEDEIYHWRDEMFCGDCIDEVSFGCSSCGDRYELDSGILVDNGVHGGRYICENCLRHHYYRCPACSKISHNTEVIGMIVVAGVRTPVCRSCIGNYKQCPVCGDYFEELSDNGRCYICNTTTKKRKEKKHENANGASGSTNAEYVGYSTWIVTS